MMAKSIIKNTSKAMLRPYVTSTHELECRDCGTTAVKLSNVVAYTCWECVASMADSSTLPAPKRPAGYPRGWKFMSVFTHGNGTVYYKGVEQPDLKGTLNPTEIKQVPKDTRSKAQKATEKQETLLQINSLKKEIKKEKRTTYRRKLESQLKQIQKKL